jgi:hypothetical protein
VLFGGAGYATCHPKVAYLQIAVAIDEKVTAVNIEMWSHRASNDVDIFVNNKKGKEVIERRPTLA